MTRIFRGILLGVVFVVLLVSVGIGLGTLVPRPFTISSQAGDQDTKAVTRRILVLSNPIHTDIALPADADVLKSLSFVSAEGLELDHPGVFWIILGWGSRSFYIETPTWADLRAKPVLDALTWDRSVMHVRRAGNIPPDANDVQAIDLTDSNFAKLLTEIQKSFQKKNGESPRAIAGAAYDAHDVFFPANGGFNAFMGCNTWTARMLREAGVKTGLWTPLPTTLKWSLELHNSL
ncbi:MAG: TIGR02117 family protein [Roseibium sp.]|uniref:TIGR02117 family protein n=1 Tax=Roseibium sp. TaxID=1936156 RepID=UPI00260DBF9B|nr:TIGR02117 family protein [Roseibium sp.]MCV0426517.1 TIGR02117 family protein [Roseibium sp.]